MLNLFWIGLAGGIGTIVRYLVGGFALRYLGTAMPYGTFTVNLVGSFVMALVIGFSLNNPGISPSLRLILTTGFLGGFTTYSSFNQETLLELQAGNYQKAFTYIFMTFIFCLVAGSFGWALGRRLSTFSY